MIYPRGMGAPGAMVRSARGKFGVGVERLRADETVVGVLGVVGAPGDEAAQCP